MSYPTSCNSQKSDFRLIPSTHRATVQSDWSISLRELRKCRWVTEISDERTAWFQASIRCQCRLCKPSNLLWTNRLLWLHKWMFTQLAEENTVQKWTEETSCCFWQKTDNQWNPRQNQIIGPVRIIKQESLQQQLHDPAINSTLDALKERVIDQAFKLVFESRLTPSLELRLDPSLIAAKPALCGMERWLPQQTYRSPL